jgi:hypothetical protein
MKLGFEKPRKVYCTLQKKEAEFQMLLPSKVAFKFRIRRCVNLKLESHHCIRLLLTLTKLLSMKMCFLTKLKPPCDQINPKYFEAPVLTWTSVV